MAHGHFNSCTTVDHAVCLCQARRFRYAFAITVGILLGEVFVGFVFNSLSLLADAAHVATDAAAIGLAMIIERVAARHAHTDEIRKKGLVASMILLVFLLGSACTEARYRLTEPHEVNGWVMIVSGVLGAAGNYWQHQIVSGGEQHATTRALAFHMLGDLISSLGVAVAGALILLTRWSGWDGVATLAISAWLLYGSFVQIIGEGHDHHGHSH